MNLRFRLNEQELEPFLGLIKKFKSDEVLVDSNDHEYYNREVLLQYDNKETLNSDISEFYKTLYLPSSEYDNVNLRNIKIDVLYDIYVEPSDFLNDKKLDILLDDINVLDMITSDIVCEQEKVIEKLEAIYNFLNSSGLLHYKKTMEHLIDKLDEHKIVNKENINNQIFPTIH